MLNAALLASKVEESGITITALATKCGMTRESYYNKLAGESEFKASEIHALTRALHLTKAERDAIFFGD